MLRKSLLRAALGILFVACAIAIPKAASANCLTDNLNSLPTDYGRQFTLTIVIGGGSWVSYSSGTTTNAGTASYNMNQTFSNRYTSSQNFDVGQADSIKFSSLNSSTGAAAIHNNTWGGSDWSLTFTCVNSTMATADTGGGGGQVILSFGGLGYIVP
jgi:hypothetical protein